ncbi:MAG: hypothetical protein ACI857_000128 [Arenicella sp.]|jgi:hypothetical protein
MKKLIAIGCIAVTAILLSSFNETEEVSNDDSKISNSEMWTFMRENVFTELNSLVSYDEEKIFSRCGSGFSQHMNEIQEDNNFVYGEITFAEGCNRQDFCEYKINWEKKQTYLKKEDVDKFISLASFVTIEKKKIAKI